MYVCAKVCMRGARQGMDRATQSSPSEQVEAEESTTVPASWDPNLYHGLGHQGRTSKTMPVFTKVGTSF